MKTDTLLIERLRGNLVEHSFRLRREAADELTRLRKELKGVKWGRDQNAADCERMDDEIMELREVTRALCDKLDECDSAMASAFHIAQIHGATYNGPTYDKELRRARTAIGET